MRSQKILNFFDKVNKRLSNGNVVIYKIKYIKFNNINLKWDWLYISIYDIITYNRSLLILIKNVWMHLCDFNKFTVRSENR